MAAIEAAARDRAGLGGAGRAARRRARRAGRRRDGRTTRCSTRPPGKRLLRDHGVPVPDGAVCASPDAAVVAAAGLPGPFAVKGLGVAHKTEQHAVRLGLVEPADVRAAAAELLARFPAVLVERLVVDGVAELLVGVQTDPVFGPVLSLGAGGVLTELVRDVAHLLLPVDARPRSAAPCSACAAPRCSPATGARRCRPRRAGRRRRTGGRAGARHAGGGLAGDQPADRHREGALGL